jgi:predicted MFS family arabinose efflux permease
VRQLISIYAMGSLVAAIPLTRLTAGWPRRPLLLTPIAGFAIVNTITAVSTVYAVTLAARLFAGVFAGLLWTLLAGYATRMVAEEHKGRALAVAMAGVPTSRRSSHELGWRTASTWCCSRSAPRPCPASRSSAP